MAKASRLIAELAEKYPIADLQNLPKRITLSKISSPFNQDKSHSRLNQQTQLLVLVFLWMTEISTFDITHRHTL